MTHPPEDIPTGFHLPVSYNEIDGVEATRTTEIADYVAEPVTMEVIQRRRAERKERGDD